MRSSYVAAAFSLFGAALGAECWPTLNPNNVNPDDVLTAVTRLANNDFSSSPTWPKEIKAGHGWGFTTGTARFCIRNDYWWDNTHVALDDVVGAVQNIHDQCGSLGGKYQVLGDTRLATEVTISGLDSSFCQI